MQHIKRSFPITLAVNAPDSDGLQAQRDVAEAMDKINAKAKELQEQLNKKYPFEDSFGKGCCG